MAYSKWQKPTVGIYEIDSGRAGKASSGKYRTQELLIPCIGSLRAPTPGASFARFRLTWLACARYKQIKIKSLASASVLANDLYSERESNPHSFNGNRILSPACLPVPPSEQSFVPMNRNVTSKNKSLRAEGIERKTRFELATPTLARSCSTN